MDEEKPVSENSRNLLIPAAIVVAGMVVAGAIFYSGGGFKTAKAPPPSRSGSQGQAAIGGAGAGEEGDPFLGNPDAPVTMVEFSDFECPFCQRFWSQALPQIKEQYIKTGKVRLVYRDFPIASIHSNAQKAAEAGECANEQGKFWEYHDIIFERQNQLGAENFKKWAVELSLNADQFASCLDLGKYAEEVAQDFRDGQAAGVNGTPSFFINGRLIVGALPFEQFKGVIEETLAGKR